MGKKKEQKCTRERDGNCRTRGREIWRLVHVRKREEEEEYSREKRGTKERA